MNLPKFTAEAAIIKPGHSYGLSVTPEAIEISAVVYPQMRATGPHGPIGFPGQDCNSACWHVCKTTSGGPFNGFGFDTCMDSCTSTCRVSLFSTFR
jgi:hypothetical protein